MIPKPIDSISLADLEALTTNGVRERRDLEFKRDLPTNSEDARREFLADVTAMANSLGGDIIYGLGEKDGMASKVIGVIGTDPDAESLRLEGLLQDGTDPRLLGVRLKWVRLETGGVLLVLRVPASLASPHAARAGKTRRFYARSSSGKYEMETHELRQAFAATDRLPAQIRELHQKAVAQSYGEEMPFRIDTRPSVVLSVTPLGFFRERRDLAVTPREAVAPHNPDGRIDSTITLEGVLLSTPLNRHTVADSNAVVSYAHTHAAGRVDASWCIAHPNGHVTQRRELVDPSYFDAGTLNIAQAAVVRLSQFGVVGPWVVMATVQSIAGIELIIDDRRLSNPAFRSGATLPELIVDTISEVTLLPLFESFWRLFGAVRPASP